MKLKVNSLFIKKINLLTLCPLIIKVVRRIALNIFFSEMLLYQHYFDADHLKLFYVIKRFVMLEILKNYKTRNTQYYKYQFNALNDGGKTRINWGAFLFGPAWWAYRKMYGPAIILMLIYFITNDVHFLSKDPRINELSRSLILLGRLMAHVVIANYANFIYLKSIKSKIEKGCNLLEEFSPTSFALGLMVFLSNASGQDLRIKILGTLGILLFAAIDYYSKSCQIKEKNANFEVTEDAVNNYLDRQNPEHIYGRQFTIVLYALAAELGTLYWTSLNKVREEMKINEALKNDLTTLQSKYKNDGSN